MARRREVAPVWVGVDVAKGMIDVARGPEGQVERVERALGPLQAWARTLPSHARVVLEATGWAGAHCDDGAPVAWLGSECRESAAGAGFRQSHGAARQDGSVGCPGARALRRRLGPAGDDGKGDRHRGPPRLDRSPAPAGRNPDRREEPPAYCTGGGDRLDRRPHRLARSRNRATSTMRSRPPRRRAAR
jgi:hypothetical protein